MHPAQRVRAAQRLEPPAHPDPAPPPPHQPTVRPTGSPPPDRPRRDPNRPGSAGGRCARRLPRRRHSTAGGGGAPAGCTRARGAAVGASARRQDAAFHTVCTGRWASVSGRFGVGCGPGTAPDGAHVCGGWVWVLWGRGRGLGRRAGGAVRSAPPIRARRETCDCRCSIPFVTALTSTAASEHPVIDGPAVSTRQGYSWCALRWLGPLARAAWRLSDAIYHCISPFHAVVLLLSETFTQVGGCVPMCATGLVHVPRMCVVGADCAAPVGTGCRALCAADPSASGDVRLSL